MTRALPPAILFLLLALALSTRTAALDHSIQAGLSTANTENLLQDSSNQSDTYSAISLSADAYPTNFIKVSALGQYTYYGKLYNLSHMLYGGGLTLIPTGDQSKWRLYFSGNAKRRAYRGRESDTLASGSDQFNDADYDATASLGYQVVPTVEVRAGLQAKVVSYTLDAVSNKHTGEFFAGANVSLPWSGSFDFEAGYRTGNFQYVIDSVRPYPIRDEDAYDVLTHGSADATYYSARVSQSLGPATGLSVTYSRRDFTKFDNRAIVYGYSTDMISPWVNDYEGNAWLMRFKTYLVPGTIITGDFGYWDRKHHKTLERGVSPLTGQPMIGLLGSAFARERTDNRRRMVLMLRVPIKSGATAVLEPQVQFDFTDNNSTIPVYEYSDITVTIGINFYR